jgi:hypothetical protein
MTYRDEMFKPVWHRGHKCQYAIKKFRPKHKPFFKSGYSPLKMEIMNRRMGHRPRKKEWFFVLLKLGHYQ